MGVLLVIDNEDGFTKRFQKTLKQRSISAFSIERVIPDTTVDPESLIADAVAAVGSCLSGTQVDAVLVDIVLYDKQLMDTVGLGLGRALKEKWPRLPVFAITSRYGSPAELDMISEATLEDLDGVILKPYFDEAPELDEHRIASLLERARQKIEGRRASDQENILGPFKEPEATVEAFGGKTLAPEVKLEVRRFGTAPFWLLVAELLPDARGAIRVLRGGRSGAAVFAILAKFVLGPHRTRPTTWILKVSRSKDAIHDEFEAYQRMRSTQASIPHLLSDRVGSIGGQLFGFVSELQGSAQTAAEWLAPKRSPATLHRFVNTLSNALNDFYTESVRDVRTPWAQHYDIDDELATKLLGWYGLNERLFRSVGLGSDLARVRQFVERSGPDWKEVSEWQGNVDLRLVHGDLNSGNVLVQDAARKVIFIDFTGREAPVCKDVAKFERDLIMRVCDRNSPSAYEWASLRRWERYLRTLRKGTLFAEPDEARFGRTSEGQISLLASLLRHKLSKHISPGVTPHEYLIALLYFTLVGGLIDDLPAPKRAFSIRASAYILRELSSKSRAR